MSELKWERLKLPPSGSMGGVSFAASDVRSSSSLVLFGGQRRGLSNALWQFSTDDGWTEHPPAVAEGTHWPPARTQASLTGLGPLEGEGRVLYLFAGSALDVGAVNDLWALTIGTDGALAEYSWSKVQLEGDAPRKRYGHSAVAWGSKMVVFGGQDNDHQFNDVWVFDPTTSRWSELRTSGATVAPRMRHTATMVTGERMLVIGGFSRETRYFGDAYLLDLASGTWEALELTGHKFSPRAQHVAVTHDGKNVFIFGGYNGAKNTNDFFLLDVSSGNVSELHTSHPPEARSRHSAHFLNETQLHIIGGFDGGKPCHGDVFVMDCSDPSGMIARGAERAAGVHKGAHHGEHNDEQGDGDD